MPKISRRERRALGIPSPVAAPDPVNIDVPVAAAEPNLSESMVLVTPEQQQQQQPWNSPEEQEPSGYSFSPIAAAADDSINQSQMPTPEGSPGPLIRKMLGMKKKTPKKSPRRRSSPSPRSPRRNSPRSQTFRRKNKLLIDNPGYLNASPSVSLIRDKLMGLAQVASRTRENSVKINKYTEKIRKMLDELNPYFIFIQQYIAGRGEIQRELDAAVINRTKLMEERERLVGDLADKAQKNENVKIKEVAEGQIGILNDQISELNKRIEELTGQLETLTRANQMYENILRDIPADIDKMRGFIDAEDASLSENITALDQVLSNFSNQLKQRLQDTLPQEQHSAFNAARGGSRRTRTRQSRRTRTRQSRRTRNRQSRRTRTRQSRRTRTRQ
jgi:prefoldin subunit 5